MTHDAVRTADGSGVPDTERSDADPSGARGPTAEPARSLTRRSLLAGLAGAASAIAVQAAGAPLPVGAASGSTAKAGRTNTATDPTTFQNTRHAANARGLRGRTTWTGTAAQSAGVEGESKGTDGIGVFGKASNGTGARAVLGISNTGTGVRGQGERIGVYGDGVGTSGIGVEGSGRFGVYAHSAVNGGIGILARATGPALTSTGVSADGVYAGVTGSGNSMGVMGSSTNGHAIRGESSGSGYAGFFTHRVRVLGDVSMTGNLSKAGGTFQVDHPLEPERRYLIHSFVEGPERLNVYRGTAKLNAKGRVTVRLPRYFEAANREPSYQLTAVGAAAPNLHVAKGVAGNRFVIAGGPAGLTVCWQVTAARDDAWARQHPIRPEQLKRKADRGRYLQPEAHGKPRSAGIDHAAAKRTRTRVRPSS
jgi:hypothetical protein